MKSLLFIALCFQFSSGWALSEKEAGEHCGGWDTTGRSELDDQVFFECVETKLAGKKKFVELAAREKHARSLCQRDFKKGVQKCIQQNLKIPSRLAIIESPKVQGRGVASGDKK